MILAAVARIPALNAVRLRKKRPNLARQSAAYQSSICAPRISMIRPPLPTDAISSSRRTVWSCPWTSYRPLHDWRLRPAGWTPRWRLRGGEAAAAFMSWRRPACRTVQTLVGVARTSAHGRIAAPRPRTYISRTPSRRNCCSDSVHIIYIIGTYI